MPMVNDDNDDDEEDTCRVWRIHVDKKNSYHCSDLHCSSLIIMMVMLMMLTNFDEEEE